MRVLVASKFWYARGGLERVMFDEVAMLERSGHVVAHYSTRHPENEPSEWSGFFAPYIELGDDEGVSISERFVAALRLFNNRAAASSFERLLVSFKPDIVHIHGIHRQISPSILTVASAHDVPVVQTLHDYHHVCPADVMLREGVAPCDPRACGKYNYTPAVRYRCVRGSLGASVLSAGETAFQRIRGVYERTVCRFISPSQFLSEVMAEAGWRVPISVLPNAPRPVDAFDAQRTRAGFVYAGRLSAEKGLPTLLEAARAAGSNLTIVGTGPLAVSLEREYPEAQFLGHLDSSGVRAALGSARAAVVPSVWFENAPMSVLEAMAAGVAVVASRIGGIPELISHDVEGLLCDPGDVSSLALALRQLDNEDATCQRLGAAGRARVEMDFSEEAHMQGLVQIYEDVIRSRRAS